MARFKKNFDWSQIEKDQQPGEEIIYVSKSEIKRDARDYRNIAAAIVELSNTKIEAFGFGDTLVSSIKLAKTLNHEARRRQINYVSKQLRAYDLEELDRMLKESQPTAHATGDVRLDKQIRVTLDRLLNSETQAKTLEVLAKQFDDFDLELVTQELEQMDESRNTNKLYSYFYDLYRSKLN